MRDFRLLAVAALVFCLLGASANPADASWGKRHRAVSYAKRHVGAPYRWGATGPWSFDCSGLVVAAYRNVGKRLPRTTYSQLGYMRHRHRLRLGDLVFSGRGHVGIYVGHRRVIHAPHPGARVQYASIYRFRYARRSPW